MIEEERPVYNEDLGAIDGRENLWRAVLTQAIAEASGKVVVNGDTPASRPRTIAQARAYLTEYNRDFNMVCSLAGLDPDAAREGLKRQFANAPSPEALAAMSRRERERATNKVKA